jgi:hypothetical protein
LSTHAFESVDLGLSRREEVLSGLEKGKSSSLDVLWGAHQIELLHRLNFRKARFFVATHPFALTFFRGRKPDAGNDFFQHGDDRPSGEVQAEARKQHQHRGEDGHPQG